MESDCDLCSCDVTDAVVAVAAAAVDDDDGADGGAAAAAAIVDCVLEPSWDESGHFDPASEDLPGRVECSRADAVAVDPGAADWSPSATACFSLPTTTIGPLIPAAFPSFVQTLAALG